MRIIDRDIEFYSSEVDEMQRCMRRCAPKLEPYYQQCIISARAVLSALIAHREAIDTPHPFDTERER